MDRGQCLEIHELGDGRAAIRWVGVVVRTQCCVADAWPQAHVRWRRRGQPCRRRAASTMSGVRAGVGEAQVAVAAFLVEVDARGGRDADFASMCVAKATLSSVKLVTST